jgi:hypothetical protein
MRPINLPEEESTHNLDDFSEMKNKYVKLDENNAHTPPASPASPASSASPAAPAAPAVPRLEKGSNDISFYIDPKNPGEINVDIRYNYQYFKPIYNFLINLYFLFRRSFNNTPNLFGKKERKDNSKQTVKPPSDHAVFLYNCFFRPKSWKYPDYSKHKIFGYSHNDMIMIAINIYQEEIDLIREHFKTVVGENIQQQYDAIQFLITCKLPSHLPDYSEKYEIKPSKYFAKDPDSKQYNIPIGLGLFAKKDLSDLDLGIVNFIYFFSIIRSNFNYNPIGRFIGTTIEDKNKFDLLTNKCYVHELKK